METMFDKETLEKYRNYPWLPGHFLYDMYHEQVMHENKLKLLKQRERERTCKHAWYLKSIGDEKVPHCGICGKWDDSIENSLCINYIAPEILLAKTKAKKKKDLETRKAATIAYLKEKGLPYHD